MPEEKVVRQAEAPGRPPTIGSVVHYVLGPHDPVFAHKRGSHRPALITEVHGPDCVSMQVFLDANDANPDDGRTRFQLLKTSAHLGSTEGSWHWPERV